ncbi:hypothetical protein ABH931_003923 [Streptacidiphilus sp. MAP12-33]|uniref:hypothetical protein n=1 Tax=Streptacidiphilus sp. MAP12-33 TaxID=3156266 RepID=UPI003512437C
MNLDFSNSPGFSTYVILLLISGIAMLVIAALNSSGQTVGWRIFNAVVGVAFLGYGVYLAFIFTGGTYFIVFKAFILPVVLLVNFLRSRKSRSTDAAAPQMYIPPQGGGAPQQPYDAAAPYASLPQAAAPYQPYDAAPPPPQAPQG